METPPLSSSVSNGSRASPNIKTRTDRPRICPGMQRPCTDDAQRGRRSRDSKGATRRACPREARRAHQPAHQVDLHCCPTRMCAVSGAICLQPNRITSSARSPQPSCAGVSTAVIGKGEAQTCGCVATACGMPVTARWALCACLSVCFLSCALIAPAVSPRAVSALANALMGAHSDALRPQQTRSEPTSPEPTRPRTTSAKSTTSMRVGAIVLRAPRHRPRIRRRIAHDSRRAQRTMFAGASATCSTRLFSTTCGWHVVVALLPVMWCLHASLRF